MRRNINRGLSITCLATTVLLTGCSSTQATRDKAQAYYVTGNYTFAYQELFPLAKRGDPDAQYTIAYMYYYGQGVAKDEGIARDWMRKSAENGNTKAKYALQLMLEDGYPAKFRSMGLPPETNGPVTKLEFSDATKNNPNSWIRQQNPEQYTLVLLPSADNKHLTELLQKQSSDNTPVISYRFQQHGQPQNGMAFGSYASSTMAELTKNKLDEPLRKSLKLAQWRSIQDVMLP